MKIDYKFNLSFGSPELERGFGAKWARPAKQNNGGEQTTAKQDKVFISRQALFMSKQNGGKPSVFEQLMKQKQSIMERRQQYVTQAMEKGTSPEVMQMELDELDAQLEKIDGQLSKLQLEEQRKVLGMDDKSTENEKINEEARNRNAVHSIDGLAEPFGAEQLKALISADTGIEQGVSVKKAQLTLNSEAKSWEDSDPARSAALKDKAEALNGKLLEIAGNVNKTVAAESRQPISRTPELHDTSAQQDTSKSGDDGAPLQDRAAMPAASALDEEQGHEWMDRADDQA